MEGEIRVIQAKNIYVLLVSGLIFLFCSNILYVHV